MSEYNQTIEKIRQSGLNKPIKLTAIYLLGLADPVTGHVRIDYDAALQVTEIESVATLRGHLSHMKQAGILEIYHCNGAVDLTFSGYAARAVSAKMLAGRALARATHANPRAGSAKTRATPTFDVEQVDGYTKPENDERALHQQNRALHTQFCAPSAREFRETNDPLSISHEGAPALVGWLVGISNNQPIETDLIEPTNQPTNAGGQEETQAAVVVVPVAIDAVEQARSYALLVAVGMKATNAKRFSTDVPFLLVRRAVGHWWLNRKSAGGKFEEGPGIVATWLADPANYPAPVLDVRFLRSELGQRFLLPNEAEALRRQDEAGIRAALPGGDDGDGGGDDGQLTLEGLDLGEVWQKCLEAIAGSIPASAYAANVAGATLAFGDGVLVVVCESPQKARWVNERLRSMLRERLAQLVGRAIPFDCLRIEAGDVAPP